MEKRTLEEESICQQEENGVGSGCHGTLRASFICCPFKTPFGSYGSALKAAIEKKTGTSVQWVASNCGCPDPRAVKRLFHADDCDYFEMPCPRDFAPHRRAAVRRESVVSKTTPTKKKRLKGHVRKALGTVLYYFRAKRYSKLSKSANVAHFQQSLESYGAKAVFHWLNLPSNAVRVVTVHELDPDQVEKPESNRTYNRADAVIVHCDEMKRSLVRMNVQEDKVHVVLHGTKIPPAPPDGRREGIIFYGSYSLLSHKGLETLFKAMSIIEQRMGTNAPVLKIHGYYSQTLRKEATRLAEKYGIANKIAWLDYLSDEDTINAYQHSQVCVLPYTGSFAGRAASVAAACQLPVVATRKAGLPDHLGEAGVWVEENNPEQLAEQVIELLGNESLRREIGSRLLKRAQKFLSWDVIAERTLEIYEQSAKKKESSAPRAAA